MKKFFALVAAVAVVSAASLAQAGSFSIVGGGTLPLGTTTGTLDIVYNPAPGNVPFANGGVALTVLSGTPGVIKFTGATTLNPAGRWTAVVTDPVTANSAPALNGFSVGSPGLPINGTSIYAQVNYEVLGPGTTTLSLTTNGEDALFDGVQGDVSGTTSLLGTTLTVDVIPEPATLSMVGMSLIGLVMRRRNG